jgi:hypothetical protein
MADSPTTIWQDGYEIIIEGGFYRVKGFDRWDRSDAAGRAFDAERAAAATPRKTPIKETCQVCGGVRSFSAPGVIVCRSEPACMEALLAEVKQR